MTSLTVVPCSAVGCSSAATSPLVQLPSAEATSTAANPNPETDSSVRVLPSPSVGSLNPTMSKLPYQKPHQVELLNLHAETEALLQQLQILKQQKAIPTPELVGAQ